MSIESVAFLKRKTPLYTINNARTVLVRSGVCANLLQADQEIERYVKENGAFLPISGVMAAYFKFVDIASFTPRVKEWFEETYGVSYSWKNVQTRAFGGFRIDPLRADLPTRK